MARPSSMSRYCLAATLARLADEMLITGLVLLVELRTGHPQDVGLISGAWTLPSLVSGPVLGAWLGRLRHRTVALAGGQLVVAACCAGLVLTVGRTPILVPIIIAAAGGLVVPGTSGGFSGLVPSLAPGATVARLNRMDAITFDLSSIAGPALAGTLVATLGPGPALLVVSLIATSGAAAAVTIPSASVSDSDGQRPAILATMRAGLRQLVTAAPLRGATLTSALSSGSVGMLVVVLPLYSVGLHAAPSDSGYLWAALEIGSLAGTVTLTRRDIQRPVRRVFLCTAAFGLVLASWPLAPSLDVALPLLAIAGVATGPTLPALFAARQRYTPPALLSQVSTTGASLKIGTFALGSALGGALAPSLGVDRIILVVATIQLVAAGIGWLAARVWSAGQRGGGSGAAGRPEISTSGRPGAP